MGTWGAFLQFLLVIIWAGSCRGHQLCLNEEYPVVESHEQHFCLGSPGVTCCHSAQRLQREQNISLLLSELFTAPSTDGRCYDHIKSWLCSECHSWAYHLHRCASREGCLSRAPLCSASCPVLAAQCATASFNASSFLFQHLQLGLLDDVIGAQFCQAVAADPLAAGEQTCVDSRPPTTDPTTSTAPSGLAKLVPAFPLVRLVQPRVLVFHDSSQSVYVGSSTGLISRFPNAESTSLDQVELVLNLTTVVAQGSSALLDLALHPNFTTNNFLFVTHLRKGSGVLTLSRFTLSTTSPAAALSSEVVLLTGSVGASVLVQPPGGALAFGPHDGMLYVTLADTANTSSAQNLTQLHGKVLRLNVSSDAVPYTIPPDNPFRSTVGTRGEIFAVGLRDIQRCAFNVQDTVTPPRLWCSDTGAGVQESLHAVHSGYNGGWPELEGAHCLLGDGQCSRSPSAFASYTHSTMGRTHVDRGDSMQGGRVVGAVPYMGFLHTRLQDQLVHVDFVSQHLGAVDMRESRPNNPPLPVTVAEASLGVPAVDLATDAQGEVYIVPWTAPGQDTVLYRLRTDPPAPGPSSSSLAIQLTIGLSCGVLVVAFAWFSMCASPAQQRARKRYTATVVPQCVAPSPAALRVSSSTESLAQAAYALRETSHGRAVKPSALRPSSSTDMLTIADMALNAPTHSGASRGNSSTGLSGRALQVEDAVEMDELM